MMTIRKFRLQKSRSWNSWRCKFTASEKLTRLRLITTFWFWLTVTFRLRFTVIFRSRLVAREPLALGDSSNLCLLRKLVFWLTVTFRSLCARTRFIPILLRSRVAFAFICWWKRVPEMFRCVGILVVAFVFAEVVACTFAVLRAFAFASAFALPWTCSPCAVRAKARLPMHTEYRILFMFPSIFRYKVRQPCARSYSTAVIKRTRQK